MRALCAFIACYVLAASAQISVRELGAVGDGAGDDTQALQAALDAAARTGTGVVVLPPGRYRITAPLIVGRDQSVQGYGGTSAVVVDAAGWKDPQHPVALRIEPVTPMSFDEVVSKTNRIFGGFTLSTMSVSHQPFIGIEIKSSAPISSAEAVNHSLLRSVLRDISVRGFDTALLIHEMWESAVEDVYISECRRGIVVSGKSVNLFFNRLTVTNFPEMRKGEDTVGLLVDSALYKDGEGRPEGIFFSHSVIYGGHSLAQIERGLHISLESNVFDGASGEPIVISSADDVSLVGNYIAVQERSSGAALVRIASSDEPLSGPLVIHNTIVGAARTSYDGIVVAKGGRTRAGVEISRNKFIRVKEAVVLEEVPVMSSVEGNFGFSAEGHPFISVGQGGEGTLIANNRRNGRGQTVRQQTKTSTKAQLRNNLNID